ncbi:MAG: hypothetical protein A3F12_01690 [Gammaproteobacteria bacterium RIFCSPHIGHO2_12_FULL_38_14]|nr:MAG: hypothetical protein A3F12_01690 [Gammaproteobacteria bacterium RIFCSPHIGHO2_12_FULL_38_14]
MKILIIDKHNKSAEVSAAGSVARLSTALDQKHVHYEINRVTDDQPVEAIVEKIIDGKFDAVLIDSVHAIDIAGRLAHDPQPQKPKIIFIDGGVEDIADKAFSDSHFSGTVAVYKSDETIFAKGYQAENRSKPEILNNEHTLFNIASLDKMITGLAIVMLAKENGFSLNKKIVDHLPPDYPHRHLFQAFTFHELLTHTSSLWRGGLTESEAFGASMADFTKVEEFLPMFFPTDPTLHDASSERGKHAYSNAGYLLLGLFIEATQEDYYRFIHEKVLVPAGMMETTEARNATSHFAIPYVPVPKNDLSKEPDWEKLPEPLQEMGRKTKELFEITKECVQKYSIIAELMSSYEKGLVSAENMETFKAEFLSKLRAAHSEFFQQISTHYFKYKYFEAGKKAESLFFELNAWLELNPQHKADPAVQELQKLLAF